MDKNQKLAELMEKSRQIFLNEQRDKLNQIMITLLDYRLHKSLNEGKELERFFHSLNGTSSTLNFDSLPSIGEEYEKYLNKINSGNEITDSTFLKLLEGLAKVHENLEELSKQDSMEQTSGGQKDEEVCTDNHVEESVNTAGEDAASAGLTESGQTKKNKILVLDDMSVIVHLIETHLKAAGYEVDSAKDGVEGIKKCKALKPDLMIVDLMLPKIDGFEVCRQIKNDPETQNVKIIIVSAKNEKDDVVRCFKIGVDDYMVKPFSMMELEQRIKNCFGEGRYGQENEKGIGC